MPLSAATTRYGSSGSWRRTCGGGTTLPLDQVVGDVEQAAEVVLVAGDPLLHVRLAVRSGGCALQHEPALRADRHDDDVLHHLRLDEAEHLGAEILRPVGPAQAAARDLAAAQVHALEAHRVHEDLEHRLRVGQPRHLRRVELERDEGPPPARPRRAASSWCDSWRGGARGTGAAPGPRSGCRPCRAPARSRSPAARRPPRRPSRDRGGGGRGSPACARSRGSRPSSAR